MVFGEPRKASIATDLLNRFGGAGDVKFDIRSEQYISACIVARITCVFFCTSCAVKAY